MFSSKNFVVFDLTFRYLIHFEFIFMYGVRNCSSFILLQVVDHFQFVNVVYYIDWFADIEESLHPWDKAHLVMVYDLFNMSLDFES